MCPLHLIQTHKVPFNVYVTFGLTGGAHSCFLGESHVCVRQTFYIIYSMNKYVRQAAKQGYARWKQQFDVTFFLILMIKELTSATPQYKNNDVLSCALHVLSKHARYPSALSLP